MTTAEWETIGRVAAPLLGIAGFAISLYNLWKGLSRERVEVHLLRGRADAPTAHRIIIINSGTVPLVLTAAHAVAHQYMSSGLGTELYDVFSDDQPKPLGPSEALVFIFEASLPDTVEVTIQTTRREKHFVRFADLLDATQIATESAFQAEQVLNLAKSMHDAYEDEGRVPVLLHSDIIARLSSTPMVQPTLLPLDESSIGMSDEEYSVLKSIIQARYRYPTLPNRDDEPSCELLASSCPNLFETFTCEGITSIRLREQLAEEYKALFTKRAKRKIKFTGRHTHHGYSSDGLNQ